MSGCRSKKGQDSGATHEPGERLLSTRELPEAEGCQILGEEGHCACGSAKVIRKPACDLSRMIGQEESGEV